MRKAARCGLLVLLFAVSDKVKYTFIFPVTLELLLYQIIISYIVIFTHCEGRIHRICPYCPDYVCLAALLHNIFACIIGVFREYLYVLP
jgi:hypothetical protein